MSTVDVWITALVATPREIELYRELLSVDELRRAFRFRFEHDQNSFVIARGKTRLILSQYLRIPPQSIRIAPLANGKPIIPDSTFHFNVSHSGSLLACAISSAGPIGVDIEQLRNIPMRGIAAKWFSSEEQEKIEAAPDKVRCFFECWTRKEAIVKATGEGMLSWEDNSLGSAGMETQGSLTPVHGNGGAPDSWFVHRFDPSVGYVGAFATQSQSVLIQIRCFEPSLPRRPLTSDRNFR